jgi:hypothetical protein
MELNNMLKKDYKWKYSTVNQIHIELSTFCNAACPMCPRTIQLADGSSLPTVRPDLKLESISVENFKKWFPPSFIPQIHLWLFCGTHGDPIMNKDVFEILEYLCEYDNTIFINTNGGMRTPEFWGKVGSLFSKNPSHKKQRQITFSMDGLWDTNHLYRRNVPFEKAINNAKAFINAGGVAVWDYLIFDHNEHQIDEAATLAKKIGFKYFVPKKALGFQNIDNNSEHVGALVGKVCRDSEGNIEYTIDPPSIKNTNFVGERKTLKVIQPSCEIKVDAPSIVDGLKTYDRSWKSTEEKYQYMINNYELREEEKCTDVVCKSHVASVHGTEMHEIYIDAYGNIFPCCYVGTSYHGKFETMSGMQLGLTLDNYGLEKTSLKNYSLQEIIESGYLQTVFEDVWGKTHEEGGLLYCNETCGIKSKIDKIYTHELDIRPGNKKIQSAINKKRKELDII